MKIAIINTVFFFLFMVIFLTSCFPVQRAAKDFGEKLPDKSILIIPPDKGNIFFSYYPYNPDKYKSDEGYYDINDSDFLKNIDDSIFYESFNKGLRRSLNKYNLNLFFSDSIDAFLFNNKKNSYIFSVAQKELIEYTDTFEQKEMFDNALYVQEFERNNLVCNVWFEFSELDNDERSMEVLFNMQFTSDLFEGDFRKNWRTGEVTYEYTPYKLEIEDVYDLSFYTGYNSGDYIVDYLFNLFLEERIGEGRMQNYYRFDERSNTAQNAGNDRFIIIQR